MIEFVIDDLCCAITEGETISAFARRAGVKRTDLIAWVSADPARVEKVKKAELEFETMMQEVLAEELSRIASADIRQVYDADGTIKDIRDLPPELVRCIESIDTEERATKGGKFYARVRKVRMYDKLRAIELLGKKLSMFVNKVEFGLNRETLEQLVSRSRKRQIEPAREVKEIDADETVV